MEITVRFPNLGFLFEYEDRTFSVLGFDITIYGILMAVSLLIGLDDSSLRQMAEIESESLLGASISALIGGVIGGRLYYIAFSWSQFSGKSWKILCDIAVAVSLFMEQFWGACLWQLSSAGSAERHSGKWQILYVWTAQRTRLIGVMGKLFNREAFGEYTDSLVCNGTSDGFRTEERSDKADETASGNFQRYGLHSGTSTVFL